MENISSCNGDLETEEEGIQQQHGDSSCCTGFMKRKCNEDEVDDDEEDEEEVVENKRSRLMDDEAVEGGTRDADRAEGSQEKKKGKRRKKGGVRRHKAFENGLPSRAVGSRNVVTTAGASSVTGGTENESMEMEVKSNVKLNDVVETVTEECVINEGPSASHLDSTRGNSVSHSEEMPVRESAKDTSILLHSDNKSLENEIAKKPSTLTSLKDKLESSDAKKTFKNIKTCKNSAVKKQTLDGKSSDTIKSRSPVTNMTDKDLTLMKISAPHKEAVQKLNTLGKSASREKFIYGNYNRYYGYRSPELEVDIRLSCFPPSLFEAKDVLDIGCNVGHVTMLIARDWKPKRIVGLDIDGSLIAIAKKNIHHYMNDKIRKNFTKGSNVRGNLNAKDADGSSFPNNVAFMQGNYVLERDDLVDLQGEEYDVILALSITKWIHLNWGDEGLKRTFRRIFRQLRPGGKLVLEPQEWTSYKRKKKLTDDIFKNYQNVKFFPQQFRRYLLSSEVGFRSCEMLGVPNSKIKGFQRPLLLFTKKDVKEVGNDQQLDLKSSLDAKLDIITCKSPEIDTSSSVNEKAAEESDVVAISSSDALCNDTNHVGSEHTSLHRANAGCNDFTTSSAESTLETDSTCVMELKVNMEASGAKNEALFIASSLSVTRSEIEDDADVVAIPAAISAPDALNENFDVSTMTSSENHSSTTDVSEIGVECSGKRVGDVSCNETFDVNDVCEEVTVTAVVNNFMTVCNHSLQV